MHALVIHNATAGDGSNGAEALVEAIQHAGYQASYQAKDDMDIGGAHDSAPDLIVVGGGDGTVAKVISHLPDRSVPLAILPTGTANNIARSLGICDLAAGLALLSSGRRRRFDVGLATWGENNARFVEAAGVGPLVAMLAAGVEADGREKIVAGREALRDAVADASRLDFTIEADGEPVCAEPLLVEVLNIGLTGPNLCFAPEADYGDGALDLVWLKSDRRVEMLAWLKHPDEGRAPLRHRRVRAAAIRGAGDFRLDDESCVLTADRTLTLRVEDRPVHILTAHPGEVDGGR